MYLKSLVAEDILIVSVYLVSHFRLEVEGLIFEIGGRADQPRVRIA